LFVLLQAVAFRQNIPSNDTYQYARQALVFMGRSHAQAVHQATELFCRDAGTAAARNATISDGTSVLPAAATTPGSGSAFDSCMRIYRNGLTPDNARYVAIFTSRPGYPLLSAALGSVLGLRLGLWLVAMLSTLAAGWLVIVLLRSAGCGTAAALSGLGFYLIAPTGYWGSRMLTDGPGLAATVLALLGAWWMTQRRIRSGAAALVGGLAAGFLFRYSSEEMVAAALALGALAAYQFAPGARHRAVLWLAAIAGGAAVVSEGLSTALGWPGITASMQDTFTHHFLRPDVSNPVSRLISLNQHYWGYFPVLEPTALLMLVGSAAVGVALWRREPVFAALVIAVAATGIGTVAAHPIASQADRLMVAVWLLPVLGAPLLVDRWRHPGERVAADSGAGRRWQARTFVGESA
jgi:hypothetical protein